MNRYFHCRVYKQVSKDPQDFDFFPVENDAFTLSGYMDIETSETFNDGEKVKISRDMYVII